VSVRHTDTVPSSYEYIQETCETISKVQAVWRRSDPVRCRAIWPSLSSKTQGHIRYGWLRRRNYLQKFLFRTPVWFAGHRNFTVPISDGRAHKGPSSGGAAMRSLVISWVKFWPKNKGLQKIQGQWRNFRGYVIEAPWCLTNTPTRDPTLPQIFWGWV